MKTCDLYLNKADMTRDLALRQALAALVQKAKPEDLRSLGFIIDRREWAPEDVEADYGSNAIEVLLDCIENSDHHQLEGYRRALRDQNISI